MRYQNQKLHLSLKNCNRVAALTSVICLLAGVCLTATAAAQDTPPLTSPPVDQQQGDQLGEAKLVQKSSEIIGFETMNDMMKAGVPIDLKAFILGMTKAYEKQKLDMSDEEIMATRMAFQQLAQQKMMAKMEQEANEGKAKETQFMAIHAQKEGVKRLASGVLYEVLNEGPEGGALPQPTDSVSIHYHGTLLDGTVFDSSVQRGQPAEFPVNRVVPGFSQSLQAMRVGDKWRVVIPSELAYGVAGQGPIGPNQTLIFEIELLKILD